jgi:hypothetical protein
MFTGSGGQFTAVQTTSERKYPGSNEHRTLKYNTFRVVNKELENNLIVDFEDSGVLHATVIPMAS